MAGLILVSCSDKKKEDGAPFLSDADPVPWLRDGGLRQRLFQTRARVLGFIRANRFVDSEKKQGNRGINPMNASLVEGPDFGGQSEGGAYLPACVRYDGRFFRTIRGRLSEEELISRWHGIRNGYRVLIVSGLYGLVAPFDPIQEYTCHFADRESGHDMSLQMLWRDLLTDIIRDQAKGEKDTLIDLLSEEAYEDAFDWHNIYGSTTCLHRVYKQKSGPETLINTALFFNDQFLGQRSELSLYPDRFITKNYFDDPREQILFESELKTTKKEVAREGIQEVQPELKRRYGLTWDSLSGPIRNQIANSEYSYKRNRDLPEFDFTSASICLSKAIEIWLEKTIVDPLISSLKSRPLLRNARGDTISPHEATIGNMSYFLRRVREGLGMGWIGHDVSKTFPAVRPIDFEELRAELDAISSGYRNGWAHKDPMPRAVFEEFRNKAVEFFNKWIPRWKKAK